MLGAKSSALPSRTSPFHSVPQLIAARAAVEPSRAAVRSRGPSSKWQDLSWSALDARRRGWPLARSLGVKRGDVVAVLAPNPRRC